MCYPAAAAAAAAWVWQKHIDHWIFGQVRPECFGIEPTGATATILYLKNYNQKITLRHALDMPGMSKPYCRPFGRPFGWPYGRPYGRTYGRPHGRAIWPGHMAGHMAGNMAGNMAGHMAGHMALDMPLRHAQQFLDML